jgi:hypothetical protein
VEVQYTVKDTTMQYVTQNDTIRYLFREKTTKQRGRQKDEVKEEKLTVSTIGKNKEHDLNRDLLLDLEVPLKQLHDSLILLYHIPDSVEFPMPFTTRRDSLLPGRAWLSAGWESMSNYRLLLLPGAVESVYDIAHDSIDIPFKTRDIEYYGQILLNLQNVHNSVIVQLVSKDKLSRQITVHEDGLYTFSYLIPRDYTIKCIHDMNENGKWDTGKYLEKLQPEPVEILPKAVTVRSNWDHDVTMTLKR